MIEIKRRERDAILQSLQAGLVPRLGLHLLQVGRKDEVAALLKDLERIEQGGAAFRRRKPHPRWPPLASGRRNPRQ